MLPFTNPKTFFSISFGCLSNSVFLSSFKCSLTTMILFSIAFHSLPIQTSFFFLLQSSFNHFSLIFKMLFFLLEENHTHFFSSPLNLRLCNFIISGIYKSAFVLKIVSCRRFCNRKLRFKSLFIS